MTAAPVITLTNESAYDNIVEKIKSIYSSCSKLEQNQLWQILQELSDTGSSYTLEQVWLSDFKEMPVSIDEFISSPMYMGPTNRNGEAVYDFWKKTSREIFADHNRYYEIILSGATRVGKTSEMVIIGAYMLYRLMLYRNPQEYFKKKEVSKITFAFANLTKELAAGVAFREFHDTLKECPWFQEHGTYSRSDRNFYYIPEGDKIEFIAGSDASMFLGKQIWCLTGDTRIVTSSGIKTLEECASTYQHVLQYDGNSLVESTDALVLETKRVKDTIRIELEDGTFIEGTPDHKVFMSDGSYKKLEDISEDDDVMFLG